MWTSAPWCYRRTYRAPDTSNIQNGRQSWHLATEMSDSLKINGDSNMNEAAESSNGSGSDQDFPGEELYRLALRFYKGKMEMKTWQLLPVTFHVIWGVVYGS